MPPWAGLYQFQFKLAGMFTHGSPSTLTDVNGGGCSVPPIGHGSAPHTLHPDTQAPTRQDQVRPHATANAALSGTNNSRVEHNAASPHSRLRR